MTDQKPDGWVIWSEEEGPFLDYKTEVYDERELAEDVSIDVFGHGYGAKGWRIRPVKLVFLDEDKFAEGKE